MPTQSMQALRRESHRSRQQYEAKAPYRPLLTVQREGAVSPSDLERYEAIPVHAYHPDGTFLPLAGYDDPTQP